ncbi:MAG TPA: methyltransferase domain-containing protein [Pyrinomonadaceae bacterium]|jgi:trans-aconitate 2-methyltransferase|nr:methyltransferase domain-containing protein [Pyrinomonadaceae bacterium]
MPWNPDCYQLFKKERFQPFDDLSRLIRHREGISVVDLGCGTGELTARLADKLPHSDVLGIDSSAEMLERAEQHARDGLRFELSEIGSVDGEWDLVFSHAAIHWIEDHPSLINRLFNLVRPGGQLAVQLPSNHTHPAHTLILEVASEEPFRGALDGWTRQSPVLSIEEYAELLYDAGGEGIVVFEKVYPHVLESSDALADWTSSTTLVPYFERLPVDLHEPFMRRYRTGLRALWPGSPVFYGFKRILFTATRAATADAN